MQPDEIWEFAPQPKFTPDWTAKWLRYRHWREWRWDRIFAWAYWLIFVPGLVTLAVFYSWR